ncbi:MAG: RNA polymerase sporulation sigma factor SigK [Oscillospiraceae bacterium]|nr:RNA polymerase sporulation sigma factor SigK [Oscillospiraceae bacterium]
MLLQLLSRMILWILHADAPYLFPKPLSRAEELACFEQMETGDIQARNRIIEHNLRLVVHVVKKYRSSPEEQEELVSIGTFGLMKAVDTFDFRKGARFSTYAARCVENEILMHFRSRKKHLTDISMNEPAMTDKDGNTLTLMDTLEDGTNLEEQVDLAIHTELLYRFLQESLDERELEILTHRYGLYGHAPLTQREVARALGISRSYVSRLEKKALAKLRERYEETPY